MIEAHLKRLRARDDISAAEEKAIREIVGETRLVPPNRPIIPAWQPVRESTLLLKGWTARVRNLANGERQFTEINISGDFIDLHSFTLKQLDHEVVALTPCELAPVPHDRLREITAKFPHLARVYWFSTSLDAAIIREWTVSTGRRSAIARVAHLFCELLVRLEIAGCAQDNSYDFPLTQVQIADCVGLTPVHANRTLQELRKRELIELRDRHLRILDLAELQRVGEFDPRYLYLEKTPE